MVQIHGETKWSSPMRLVRECRTVLRILPGPNGFVIDRWFAWHDLTFSVDLSETPISLVGSNGRDVYRQIV